MTHEPHDRAGSDRSTRRLKWIDLVRGGLLLLAIALAVAAIAQDVNGFTQSVERIGFWGVLVALALTLVGLLLSAEAWRLNIGAVAGRIPPSSSRRIFFVTQLGKYLPGAVWTVLGQVDLGQKYQISRSRMAIGAILFLALHLLTGLIIVVAFIPWVAPELVRSYPWLPVLLPFMMAGLVPPVLNRTVNRVLRLLRRPPLPESLSSKDIVLPSMVLMGTWLCYGVGVLVVVAPLTDEGVDLRLVAISTGAFALAWIVGVLVLPAPAGIGPREVVLVLTLSPFVGAIQSTSIVVVLRVVHTASDLLLATAGRMAAREDG